MTGLRRWLVDCIQVQALTRSDGIRVFYNAEPCILINFARTKQVTILSPDMEQVRIRERREQVLVDDGVEALLFRWGGRVASILGWGR